MVDILALELTYLKLGRKISAKLNPSQKEVLIEQAKTVVSSVSSGAGHAVVHVDG